MKQKLDQTDFMIQTPFSDEKDQYWIEEGQSRIKIEKPFFKTRKGIIVIVFSFVFLLILFIGLIILFSSRSEDVRPQPSAEPTPIPVEELTSLQLQIQRLREQLKEADPTKRDTPFPQVDLDIRID